MKETADFLVEIGTEELPPKALKRLIQAFSQGLLEGLQNAGLASGEMQNFATPRRLAVYIKDLQTRQADRAVERRGPALTAAYDEEGCPTKAAQGFARSCGVSVEELDKLETAKGTWLVFRSTEKGQDSAQLLSAMVEQALAGLPIPKRMRWGNRSAEFVRPIHWIVLLLGTHVVKGEILGIKTGQETRGHRFHHPQAMHLTEPANYAPLLETTGHVLAHYEDRRAAIRAQVQEAGQQLGGVAVIAESLLDEVTALVEWPVAVAGSFDQEFLQVPAEALISSMQDHQKYFPVRDKQGNLLPHFITVANIESKDPTQVRLGNERVIRPRLSDAAFFWTQDRKKTLAKRIDDLRNVVFQKKLGSLFDRTQRLASLSGKIAHAMGTDAQAAQRAGELAKCDLMTEMVGEFPDLQGIMGRYYAVHDGETAAVADAIEAQYLPRFAGDRLPEQATGQALALAEKLDTLTGIFGIGQIPTGSKDPFALRRAALGVLRILIECRLDLNLKELLCMAVNQFRVSLVETTVPQTQEFILDRLRAYYQDAGIPADRFAAVLACKPERPLDFDQRVRAVTAFCALEESKSLAAANKRIRNILKQADGPIAQDLDPKLLQDPAEQELAQALQAAATAVQPLIAARDYSKALTRLAQLRTPVDSFFDQVMVMAEEPQVRQNRLALLSQLSSLFLQIADISVLQEQT